MQIGNRRDLPLVVVTVLLGCLALIPLGWFSLIVLVYGQGAFHNRHHQAFAVHGVKCVPLAGQFEKSFPDCWHSISYGPDQTPLLVSEAYFGDRYQLRMEIPVRIDSATEGAPVGPARLLLLEFKDVTVLADGRVSASFSGQTEFDQLAWEKVLDAGGDFTSIGYPVNPLPVANFAAYVRALHPEK